MFYDVVRIGNYYYAKVRLAGTAYTDPWPEWRAVYDADTLTPVNVTKANVRTL